MGMAVRQAASERSVPIAGAGPGARPLAARRAQEAAGVLLLLVVAACVRIPTLDQPLLETHAFRQTQTAYTALLYHEQGVDLLHPKLPVLGAPFEVPFEFPLFQALAAAPMSWGLAPDVAMRATALACFLLSALLLWGLVRHAGGRAAALAALAAYLFSPFSLLWSRSSLIEYLAVAGAMGWVWAGLLWRDRRRAVYAAAALVAGLVAMLVKPTTAAFWALSLLAYTAAGDGEGWRSWVRARAEPVLAGILVVPFLAAMAWTGHADAIKEANPATAWLTSAQLSTWNFGTLDQRLMWENWSRILRRITGELTGYPALLLPLAALVGARTRQARFWVAVVAVPALTVLCFWNLYVIHDYYLAAISPAPAVVAGLAFARGWGAVASDRARRLLAGLLGTWVGAVVILNPGYSRIAYQQADIREALPEAEEVVRLTRPTDLVLFEGYDWAPVLPYYSRRGGHMISTAVDRRTTPAGLAAEGYRLLITSRLASDLAADTIRAGRWTGVLGQWVYVAGDSFAELRGAPIAATDALDHAGPLLLEQPVTIPCGRGGAVLPRADGITVLRLAAGTAPEAKLSVAEGYGDVPVRGAVVLAPTLGAGPLRVDCRDAVTVTVVAVEAHPAGSL